ncbi:hypothetical protein GCM10011367_17190 [Marinicauda pacifica]|uniref:Uncharacterized protein n=1 Tax=Marinicauda pacifica TaxID=1133559 RepID=A0A4S2HB09_9PROT|nr:hypothetical protein [Marinicauda pacifica]TGY93125.1 hypothetical protein E5162_08665 [Marinicauda pacifica]GGE43085.1 hypothetical protein GCM10011367_17190 [Marinicauda pacifica]
MAGQDTHFEVFLKKSKLASWTLVEARPKREDALALGEQLKKMNPSGSIRVTREDYDDTTRAFRSIAIFESGPEKYSDPKDKKGEAKIPCVTPADLAGPAARETTRRVLGPWLERHQICPMELLYRPDMVEKLDSSDTDLQHAIQKIAVARAQNSDASVHAYVRLLTDLVQRAIDQARREAQRKAKTPKAASFSQLAEKIVGEGSPEKRLRTAIADEISDCTSMTAKATKLLDMLDDLPEDPEARVFASRQADAFLAEVLSFDRALRGLLGEPRDGGEEIVRLTTIYEGKADAEDLARAPETARRLARKFKAKGLPATQAEVAARILTALRSPKRLKPNSVMDEIKLARSLAMRLIASSGPDLHPDSLVEAFTHRSARLLSPDAIDEALKNSASPHEEIMRLLAMEDNLVGEMNKQKLASYVRTKLRANSAESWYSRGPGQPLERLSKLSQLQARTLAGTFPQADKTETAQAFDELGLKVLESTKIVERIASSGQPALARVSALLKLAAQNVLPQGRCLQDAHARAMRLLASPEGRQEAAGPDGAARLGEIQRLLVQIAPQMEEAEAAAQEIGNEDASAGASQVPVTGTGG